MVSGQETDHRRCLVATCQTRYTTGDGQCVPTNSREVQGQHYSHSCYDHFYTRNGGKYSKLLLVTTCRFSSSCPQIKILRLLTAPPPPPLNSVSVVSLDTIYIYIYRCVEDEPQKSDWNLYSVSSMVVHCGGFICDRIITIWWCLCYW